MASNVQKQTGERRDLQKAEDNREPVEEIIEAKVAVAATGEKPMMDVRPETSCTDGLPAPIEEVIIPREALGQAGALYQNIESQIAPEAVPLVMMVIDSLPLVSYI